MKIVHVSQPVTAGVAVVVLELALAQRDWGWDVTVACPPSGWLADRLREARIDVRAWAARRSPGLRSAGETLRLRRLLSDVDPDVVHLHSSKAGLAGRLAVRRGLPTVFQPHLWSFATARGPLRHASARWERFASRWTDLLVCVSDDELAAGRAAGVTAEAHVVCNGVDTSRFTPGDRAAARRRLGLPAGAPLAVCVGRLAELKGQDQLLSAWPDVLRRVPDARLAFAGDGPMGPVWRRHPVAGHASVVWAGHTADPAAWYTAADVVVLPSRAEGMALVPLEAMACARPVVAFDVGGMRQSIADAGAVLPPGDLTRLAAAVATRLADPALAAREGERGRRRAELSFDRGRMTDQIAALVDKLTPAEATS
ncbi:glycosyltransferase [Amycolatopsis australiensis]|uniref:Glycosyltransferase involved in cell wall bisynthesis n=1 Tax=Amycolatopsis australiensis TaxID=546364 RepID=A0A1K1S1E9_9PSEU|nr:glycosyltransferase [Amycolatopsis australiensis]SFW78134.1 Glycosyltransferase involved in cell wall bisynthesis [Amycolatopsis australiensis]